MKRLVFALAAAWLVVFGFRPEPPALAATVPTVFDQKLCTGTAAANGGTMTCDYAPPTDRAVRLVALVGFSSKDASLHLNNVGFLTCEYVVENRNGVVSAATALSGSNNPANDGTTTFVASHAQALDTAFTGVGGAPSTCAFSISGANARVTVTNVSNTSVAADLTVLVTAFTWGSQ